MPEGVTLKSSTIILDGIEYVSTTGRAKAVRNAVDELSTLVVARCV